MCKVHFEYLARFLSIYPKLLEIKCLVGVIYSL